METDAYHIADLLPEALRDLADAQARAHVHAEDRPAAEAPHPAPRWATLPPPRSMNALLLSVMHNAK